MAVIQDPQGAWFLIWQPNQHHGAGLVNAPGALCWNELGSPDLDGSAAFYGGLFGWTTSPMEGGEMPYLVISNGDRSNGGIRPPMPPGTPPFWLVYFAAEDLDARVGQGLRAGRHRPDGQHRHRDRQDRGGPGPAGRRVRAVLGPSRRLTQALKRRAPLKPFGILGRVRQAQDHDRRADRAGSRRRGLRGPVGPVGPAAPAAGPPQRPPPRLRCPRAIPRWCSRWRARRPRSTPPRRRPPRG